MARLLHVFLERPINILLLSAPLSWAIWLQAAQSSWVFVLAAASLVPAAGLILRPVRDCRDRAVRVERLRAMQDQIYKILATRSGKPLKPIIRDTKRTDFYLDAQKAKEYGLIDDILG